MAPLALSSPRFCVRHDFQPGDDCVLLFYLRPTVFELGLLGKGLNAEGHADRRSG